MKTNKTHNNDLTNKDIQRDADTLFNGVIGTFKTMMPDLFWRTSSEENQNDKGIDYQIEVENRNTRETIIIFKTQNKGTDEQLVPIRIKRNKGLIQFSIKVKHVNYYRKEINIALVYIICDLISNIVYWHPIQLDDSIDEQVAIAEKKKHDSVSMYIQPSKQLNVHNIQEFMSDVIQSQQVQTYRYQKYISHDLLTGNNKTSIDRKKPMLAQLRQFTDLMFKELRFYPTDLMIKNYPFVKEKKSWVYYSGGVVETDNEELIDFLNSVEIAADGTITFNDLKAVHGVEEPEKKFREFYDHLTTNLIYSITNRTKTYNLEYERKEECDCSYCLYLDLRFSESLKKNILPPNPEIREIMSTAYVNYKFGNYVTAAELFKSVLPLAKGQPETTIICEYNLVKLGNFIRTNYLKEYNTLPIVAEIKKIDLEQSIEKHRTTANGDLLKWIAEGKSFERANDQILEYAKKIKEHHTSQLNRGWSSNSHINMLFNAYAQVESFLNGNFVIYDRFQEYNEMSTVFSEAVYTSYSMNEEQESRLMGFSEWTIEKLIFNCEPQKLIEHFRVFNIKEIQFNRPEISISFLAIARNLFTKNSKLIHEMENYLDYGRNNFIKKYKNICSNVIILASQLVLSDIQVEELIDLLIPFFRQEDIQKLFSAPYFSIILARKSTQISNKHLKQLFALTIKDPYFSDEDLILYIIGICEGRTLSLKINKTESSKLLRNAFESKKRPNGLNQKENFYHYYEFLSPEQQADAGAKIESILIENFSVQEYYLAAINNILPASGHFFEAFKKVAVPREQNPELSGLFGRNMNASPYTDMFLNLCFKNDLDLTGTAYDHFRGVSPYYDWLTNLSGFDYSVFDVKWLLTYPTDYYSKAFKKHSIIKKELGAYLRKNRDEQLERFYIDVFSE